MWKRSPLFFSLLLILLSGLTIFGPSATAEERAVYVIPIEDGDIFMVDLGMVHFVERAVRYAEEAGAVAIIFDIKTFGGRLDAAIEIKETILATELKTIAFVQQGISAGALITLACEEIVVVPGSTIGAATPVGLGGEALDEKAVSFVRAQFRATSDLNNHPALLTEAMVDPAIEIRAVTIDGELRLLTPAEFEEKQAELGPERVIAVTEDLPTGFAQGKVVTLTAEQAARFRLAAHQVSRIEDVLPLYGLEGARLLRVPLTWSEQLVRFLTHAQISSLLLTLGMLGLMFEVMSPGQGIGAIIGLLSLALFFFGRYLAGLAEWAIFLVPALLILGLVLLVIEVHIFPEDFGLLGILGIASLGSSFVLAIVGHDLPAIPGAREYLEALEKVSFAIIITFAATVITVILIPRMRFWEQARARMVLTSTQASELGFRMAEITPETLRDKEGVTVTPLRPAGKARFEDKVYDVVAEGEFMEAGERVKVIKVEGNRIIVMGVN